MTGKLRDGRIDGLILHANSNDPLVEILRNSSLPVVAIADALPGISSVTCDDEAGIRQSIDYLWQRGHRRFTYLCPVVKLPSVDRRRQPFEPELQRRALHPAGSAVFRT